LVDLAVENGALAHIEKDVADLKHMIEGSEDLQAMLRSPLIKASDAQKALTALADQAKFSDLTKNFLLLLAANRRLPDTEQILKAVESNLSARRGELSAKVESATPLTESQAKALAENLSKTIGQPVAVESSVNKALIGGVTITLGSLMIDDSIKTKLERMGRAMKHSGKAA
jgi:F-type H+-transporting ATPase subunit delta